MKIYFTASARGIDEFGADYTRIYEELESMGYSHVDTSLGQIDQEKFYSGEHEDRVREYEQAMKYIKSCDVVVLEVSMHSLSMGYVLQRALNLGKPVIAIYRANHAPQFALVIEDEKLQVLEYDDKNLKQVLKDALEYAQESSDTRFNFFISPRHIQYLDWVAKTKKIPRSVYLRDLIKRDMDQNNAFLES